MARARLIGKPLPPRAEWPTCTGCGRKLAPRVWRGGVGREEREWDGAYHGYGYTDTNDPRFHSLRCALDYALRAARYINQRGRTLNVENSRYHVKEAK